jgi:NTE family protein
LNNRRSKPRFGLALSGGGARGLAHIGVLKELERANIQVAYLAGTSMGGVIGAVYAAGMSPDEIEGVAQQYGNKRQLIKLIDPTVPRRGLFQGQQLHAFFRQYLHDLTFADLRIPLTLVSADLNSGQEVHLQEVMY